MGWTSRPDSEGDGRTEQNSEPGHELRSGPASGSSTRPTPWEESQAPSVSTWLSVNGQPGSRYSYDWCRFRRNSHCFFTGIVDTEASSQAGYAVYVPMDRGYCWRSAWETQRKCQSAQPGPNADDGFSTLFGGEELAYTDATVPWEAMGQRGSKVKNYAPPGSAASTPWIDTHPVELAEDQRVTMTRDSPALDPAATGGHVSNRTRALGDLVQLRTGGLLTFAEFKMLRARIDRGRSVLTTEVPLGILDATIATTVRLTDLESTAVITRAEADRLRQRLGRPLGTTASTPSIVTKQKEMAEARQTDPMQSQPDESSGDVSSSMQRPGNEWVRQGDVGGDPVDDVVRAMQPQIRDAARFIAANLFGTVHAPTGAGKDDASSATPADDRGGTSESQGPAPTSVTAHGLVEQLETLAELHEAGLLNLAEFAEAKRRLLHG